MRRLSLLLILSMNLSLLWCQDSFMSILKASALVSGHNPEEAVNVLSSVLQTNQSADLYCARGEAYLSERMTRKASEDFSAAESLCHGKGLYGLAKCAAVNNDSQGAVGYLEALMKTDCKKAESEIQLDTSFNSISSSVEWRNFWKKEWYKGYEKSRAEIEYYLRVGKLDLAKEEYNSLRMMYPDTETDNYCKALIAIATGDPASASAILTKMIGSVGAKPEYLKSLARAYGDAGNYFSAAVQYGELIRTGYNDATLFLLRGEMLKKAGDRDDAIKDFETYLSLYPDDYKALSLMGRTKAENGSLFEALTYLNKNIEKNPGKADCYNDRGDAYSLCRSWENAIADYSMSLDLNPEDGNIYLNMAVAMINAGKSDTACPFLRKALDLGQKEAAKYISRYCNK